ncbi:MAG TPA: peptidoglycan DD-metalloendopeptidase family protein [Ilumatobacter sp.]|nr:peptidoglycan DD-metalloendopeptidase family protein [Ilumatobacter sp.]
MKAGLASTASILIGLTIFPALLANGDPPPITVCGVAAGPTEVILQTIRTLESGGDYTAQARGSTASGAYQFINSTWGGYSGYNSAADAPPEIQDAKATEMVIAILDRHSGDVSAVPVGWYIGRLPAPDSPAWDTVPVPGAGNVLTPREYQQRWLTKYDELLGATPAFSPASSADPVPGSCFGGSVQPIVDGWSLPGPRDLIDANPSALTNPHHDYPAWDWMIPINTAIYAMRGGRVATVRTWPHNWWANGCGINSAGCETCGVGLTIVDTDNTRWTYCHGIILTVQFGDEVTAGQQIMWSGNTGRSGAPHLHLEIRTTDGQRRCPQSLLLSLIDAQRPHVLSLPTTGCS